MVGTRYRIQKCKTGWAHTTMRMNDIMTHLFSPGGVEDAAMRGFVGFLRLTGNVVQYAQLADIAAIRSPRFLPVGTRRF